MKRTVAIIILLALVVITFLSARPRFSSEELTEHTVKNGDTVRTEYRDDEGSLTTAYDKGYAVLIKTYDDERLLLEEYLDDAEHPVKLQSGYSKVRYGYNEEGKNTLIEYLDESGERAVITNGYDTIKRSFTDGRADTDTYYADGESVTRKQGYAAYKRIYSDGKLSEIRYLDAEGEPVLNSDGFAVIKRTYDGEAVIDMYFDEEGSPVASSLGQYGVRREGDVTTYLDAEGDPADTTRGYAVMERDGITTRYYDTEGNPVTIGAGHYGVRKVQGQNVYLDENGDILMRLDNYLFTHPMTVLVAGVLLTLIAPFLPGKQKVVFAVFYGMFILYMTMMYRETGDPRSRFDLFWSYRMFLSSPSTRQSILNNIWLFAPLGAVLYRPGKAHRILWCLLLSVVIETVQYYSGIGLCEIDDLVSNTLGGLIGFGVAYALKKSKVADKTAGL